MSLGQRTGSWVLCAAVAGCSHLDGLGRPEAEDAAVVVPADAGRAPDGGGADGGGRPDGGGLPADAGVRSARLPVESDGDWTVFTLSGGRENPAELVAGIVSATAVDGGMRFTAELVDLPADYSLVLYLHELVCSQQQGGPHYQHAPAAAGSPEFFENVLGGSASTDLDGALLLEMTTRWVPRAGGASSIVVSEGFRNDAGVMQGERLACTDLRF